MNNAIQASNEGFHAAADKLTNDISVVATQATGLLKNIGSEQVEAALAALSQAQAALTQGARRYSGKTNDYVTANPWQSLAIAAALGALAAVLVARR